MKGYDAFAGVIKSGGKTRRAAKMVILDADHPDIVEFINCKVEEEKKAWALIDAGYDGSFTGPAYSSVFFQNSNNSVRVTDDFMRAVMDDGVWETRAVTRSEPVMDTYKARDLMRLIAEGTHVCGDPACSSTRRSTSGTPVRDTDRIYASNPCSGSMFLNDSACNLAVDQPDEVREDGWRRSAPPNSTSWRTRRRSGRSSRRRKSSSTTRAIRRQAIETEQPRLSAARARLREPRRAR